MTVTVVAASCYHLRKKWIVMLLQRKAARSTTALFRLLVESTVMSENADKKVIPIQPVAAGKGNDA